MRWQEKIMQRLVSVNSTNKKKKEGIKSWILNVNEVIQYKESESINVTTMCADKYRKTLSEYDIKGEEKTSSMSEKIEKELYGYVCIYECGKH